VMINIKGIWAALKFFTVLAATLPKWRVHMSSNLKTQSDDQHFCHDKAKIMDYY
jgi:hypothetical protein